MRPHAIAALVGAVAAVLTAQLLAALVASPALADGDAATDSVPRLVNYEGTLASDGEVVTGPFNLRFTLYDDATPVWTEEHRVDVHAGRFAVTLGARSPIGTVLAAADPLELGVTLLNDPGSDDDIALSGRQAFVPVPFALWAATSSDLTVAGDARVTGEVRVTGTTRANGPIAFDTRGVSDWNNVCDSAFPDTARRSYECPPDQYVCGLQVLENIGSGQVRNVRVKCCSLGD